MTSWDWLRFTTAALLIVTAVLFGANVSQVEIVPWRYSAPRNDAPATSAANPPSTAAPIMAPCMPSAHGITEGP